LEAFFGEQRLLHSFGRMGKDVGLGWRDEGAVHWMGPCESEAEGEEWVGSGHRLGGRLRTVRVKPLDVAAFHSGWCCALGGLGERGQSTGTRRLMGECCRFGAREMECIELSTAGLVCGRYLQACCWAVTVFGDGHLGNRGLGGSWIHQVVGGWCDRTRGAAMLVQ